MKEVTIFLKDINSIEEFSKTIESMDYDFDIVQGRYVIDAKSIMGLFCLDISLPLKLQIHCNNLPEYTKIIDRIKPFIKV